MVALLYNKSSSTKIYIHCWVGRKRPASFVDRRYISLCSNQSTLKPVEGGTLRKSSVRIRIFITILIYKDHSWWNSWTMIEKDFLVTFPSLPFTLPYAWASQLNYYPERKSMCEDISLVFNSNLETRGIILRKFMFQTIYGQKFFLSPAFCENEVICINSNLKCRVHI